ncbi:MAG: SDR family oxidoreductase [Gemmatimonadetes bacterium]|nr:SDR family oxidoreductase [Gemmatimonadota bacterium]
MNSRDLSGKAAIVTGASRGIGRAIAEALLSAGAAVALAARSRDALERTAAELAGRTRDPARLRAIPCDVRRYEDCRRLVAEAVAAFGRLDIVVNNAGIGHFAPVPEMRPQDWRDVLATNLDGVFYCCREAVPHLRKTGGWIINIGSLAGKNAFAGGAAYNASKFALLGFSEALMQDVRHDGIRVSTIAPGSVATEFSSITAGQGEDWKLRPQDVARAVVDLLAFPDRALPSLIEMRPSRPPKK